MRGRSPSALDLAEMERNVLRPYKGKNYERKRTDSRWKVLTAMKMATAA